MNKRLLGLFFASLLCAELAMAGSTQGEPPKFEVKQVSTFAKQVEKYAASKGARVFIIARVGRFEKSLPKGVIFTHTALAVYSDIELRDGNIVKGYAIHNLYQNSEKLDLSTLVTDYPLDFFMGAFTLKAGIIIPEPALQQRLLTLISRGDDKLLHNPHYSVLSNPFNNKLQNCTEYTLDLINAAIYQTTDGAQLKKNAKAHFTGQLVRINPLMLMLASMFKDDITTKDHHGKIYTATFSTIGAYLKKNELAAQSIILDEKGVISQLL